MAFTKILGPGIHTLANFHSHNINSSGIITATKFVGDMTVGSGSTGTFSSLTITGNLGVGGTVTYTDVTNVDAIGIITAQSGIYIGAGATVGSLNTTTGISSFKKLNVDETSTFNGSVGIADSIIHIGNTDTSIRFPSDDTFTVETAGSEALRIDSTGRLLLNTTTEGNPNADDFTISFNNTGVSGGDQGRCGMTIRSGDNTSGVTQPGYIYFSDGTSGDNESKGAIAYDHNVDDMYLATDGVERLRIGSTGISTFLKDLHVAQAGTGSTIFINSTTHNTSVASTATLQFGYTHSGGQAVGYIKLEEGAGNSFDGNLTVGVPYNIGGGNFGTRDALTVKFSGDVDLYGATAGVTSCTWDASENALHLYDDVKAKWGNGGDLQISHSAAGSGSDTIDSSAGYMYINSDALRLNSKTSAWNYLRGDKSDGVVKLYKSDSEKLATSDTGITVTGEVAATQDYPNYRPTLDLNFAAEKKLDPRITYYRTGPASYVDEFGKVVLVGDNAPRFDHDLTTRESKGLLIEESRTNLIPNSFDQGSAWNSGSAGTLTRNAGIAPDGTNTATKALISSNDIDTSPALGPASEGATTQIAISGSTTYTLSIWAKASTTAQVGNNFKVRWKRITGDGASSETTFTLTADWKRYSTTGTTAANNTTMSCYVGGVSGSEALVWGAQLEAGGFATSLIPTNGSSATRGTENIFIEGQDFTDVYNVPEGTFVLKQSVDDTSTSNQWGWGVEKSTNRSAFLNGLGFRVGGGGAGYVGAWYNNNGTTSAFFNMNADALVNIPFVSALAYKVNDMAATTNGITVATDTSASIADAGEFDRFTLGGYHYDTMSTGHIQRVMYYRKRLPDAQLVTLTS